MVIMESERGKDMNTEHSLIDEICLFIEYAVTAEEQEKAKQTVKKYQNNSLILAVLHDFYRILPDLCDQAVVAVDEVVARLGCYLLEVRTSTYAYLYFYDGENAVYVGEKRDGVADSKILSFFGYANNEQLKKNLDERIERGTKSISGHVFCPACSVKEGEIHELGCPVEICPWCDSQFTYCNCRFEKLGLDEIESDEDLDRLEIILNEKGRIPFSADQAPSYPVAGEE